MSPLPPQPLSPLDGRYRAVVEDLGEYFSEAGLNRARVLVEVEWLIALSDRGMFGSAPLEAEQARQLRRFASEFGENEIARLAELEATTRHDVKAVEYLVREKLTELGLTRIAELTHFACTSEDINNLSHALMIQDGHQVMREGYLAVLSRLLALAEEQAHQPMLSRTHGRCLTSSR